MLKLPLRLGQSFCSLAFVLCLTATASAGPIDDVAKSVVLIRTPSGLGTGFVVDNQSLIATNLHVVEGADTAIAEFSDGTAIPINGFIVASVGCDLAVLELAKPAGSAPLKIAAEPPSLGADVFAVVAPRGLAGSVTKGVVSAHRKWSDLKPLIGEAIDTFGYEQNSRWVQTDAAITSGNSGGPLVLASGEVAAISTLAVPSHVGQNINFAVDARHLKDFLANKREDAIPLNRLPKSTTKTTSVPKSDGKREHATETQAFWDGLASVLADFETERRKQLIAAGAVDVPQANQGIDMSRVPKHKVSNTQRYRLELALKDVASKTGMSIEELVRENPEHWGVLLDTPDHPNPGFWARMATAEKKNKDKARSRKILQNQQMSPVVREFEQARQLGIEKENQEKAFRRSSASMKHIADSAIRAARLIETLDARGVNEGLVKFSEAIAASLRLMAARTTQAVDEVDRIARNLGNPATIDDTLAQQQRSVVAYSELVNVSGNDLRTRLGRLYDCEFGPVIRFTPDQLELFRESNQPK